jgi:uncharacterized protein (DUF2147 family)
MNVRFRSDSGAAVHITGHSIQPNRHGGTAMTALTKIILVATLALGLVVTPASARTVTIPKSLTPVGTWEVTTGEARYQIELCGDGTQICATLTWLRDDVRTDVNLSYLNKTVIEGAKQSGPIKWEGKVIYEGDTYSGAISLVNSNTLKMAGCKAIACNTLLFNRI